MKNRKIKYILIFVIAILSISITLNASLLYRISNIDNYQPKFEETNKKINLIIDLQNQKLDSIITNLKYEKS